MKTVLPIDKSAVLVKWLCFLKRKNSHKKQKISKISPTIPVVI
jgi:hypothetical protein